jgi:hypothetical protein
MNFGGNMNRANVVGGLLIIIFTPLLPAFTRDAEAGSVPAKTFTDGTVVVETGRSENGPWNAQKTRLLALLDGYTQQKPVAMDLYGGRADQKGDKATGFFYTAKVGNRWWLIDPAGNRYFNIALDVVSPGSSAGEKSAFQAKYGSEDNWKQSTTDFLWNNGFSCLGNWSDWKLLSSASKPLSYTIGENFMAGFAKQMGLTVPAAGHSGFIRECFPVFHPDFPAYCDSTAQSLAATAKDPHLLGIFSDNELQTPADMLDRNLTLDFKKNPNLKPGYDAAVAWLAARRRDPKQITNEDRSEFVAYVFDTYYKIVSTAIRKYDPNHLFFGERLMSEGHAYDNQALWKVIGQYVDVVSVNYYHVWGPDSHVIDRWVQWSQKPIMLTEWYAKAVDVPDLANAGGAGWIVRTQEDRAKYYEHFMLDCYESGNIVGAHYFKYQDDPSDSVRLDSKGGANKGIFNSQYVPYHPLVQRAQAVNLQVYSLIDFFDNRK